MPTLQEILETSARYQIAGVTGAVAAASGAKIIFYAQNTSATKVVLVEHVKINGHIATTAYAVGQVLYELHIARGFTAENGAPGGTPLTISGANQRLKTSSPTMGMGVIRIAGTTSTGLVAPTWTLDANPVGQLNSHSSAEGAAATPIVGSQFLPNNGDLFAASLSLQGGYPIVLGANEGIGIRVTVPATGVAIHGITMKWSETDRASI